MRKLTITAAGMHALQAAGNELRSGLTRWQSQSASSADTLMFACQSTYHIVHSTAAVRRFAAALAAPLHGGPQWQTPKHESSCRAMTGGTTSPMAAARQLCI